VASKGNIGSNVVTVGIEEEMMLQFQVYPNPTKSSVKIISNETVNSLQLSDLQGKVLLKSNPYVNEVTIDLTNYPEGMYLATSIVKGKVIVRKVIKQ
jgi:hypothetical protein